MASAETALQWLRDNLGIGEHPPGSNHNTITERWGIGNVQWCAETVSLAMNVAWGDIDTWQVPGVPADYRIGTAFVPNLRRYFMDAGRYSQEPSVGAVVINVWGPGAPIGDHTGVVEAWVDKAGRSRTDTFVADEWDGTVITLEGNANDDLIRTRRSMAVIDGFGHPPYDDSEEDDMTGAQAATLEYCKLAIDEIKDTFAQFADPGDPDPWQGGRRKFVLMQKAVDERSKAAMDKLDAILKSKSSGGGTGGGTVDTDAIAEAVADRIYRRMEK
jgi:CHAP domain